MNDLLADNALQKIVQASFLEEVYALKPGNVSSYADGHGMTLSDFTQSAELVTPILCNPSLTVGERIYQSVVRTKETVSCNTNLGMLLLFAPLIRAAEHLPGENVHLQHKVEEILQVMDSTDTSRICEAIRIANPGGLGSSNKFDVGSPVNSNIMEVMAEASDKDSIARQYVTNFQDIFSIGVVTIKDFNRRWNSVEWATVAGYMTFLTELPDSHIRRKFGVDAAENIRIKASQIAKLFKNNTNPADAKNKLLEFDTELKNAGINPGTSADLTAASLLVYKLTEYNN